ncbi:MAG: diacylglycerol kinase family lipid kinase [Ferruginibacter sp.]|nr:diacylglycerol kinase family lipid kinase [Ferruginibacter sp.]
MTENCSSKILFIINPKAGAGGMDWHQLITDYYALSNAKIEIFKLPENCSGQMIVAKINASIPQVVVAVGGDGTIKLVAACLINKDIKLGILPAGSANGLAKELGISEDTDEALRIIENENCKKIHVTNINGQLCIHLSDIGFNAYAMKGFSGQQIRGMWGYVEAYLKILFKSPLMEVEMLIDEKTIKIKAVMIVIANATKYCTGAIINPIGKLDDDMFEVIAVKKISIRELFKMTFSHALYDLNKTEIFQVHTLVMKSVKKVHFQVDGEYIGLVNEVKAVLVKDALKIIIPAAS